MEKVEESKIILSVKRNMNQLTVKVKKNKCADLIYIKP